MARKDTLDLGSWFILRMASAETLRVASNLRARGYSVWTPIEHKFGRMPRTRAKYEKQFPLMPSYVFVHVEHLDDVLSLAVLPVKQCGRFSVFHHKGGIPLIGDDQLSALRGEESRITGLFERWKRKGVKVPKLEQGTAVNMTDGPFTGLSGVVEGTEGQHTLVSFAGFHAPIKIASLLLHPSVLADELSNAA